MCKSHLSQCHPFLQLPISLPGWDDSTAPMTGHSFLFTVLSHILWGYWSWGWRVSLAVKTVYYSCSGPSQSSSIGPNTLFRSLQPRPIHEHTRVCTHKSQLFLNFPYFAKSIGFRCTSCGLMSSSFPFLLNVLNHQKGGLKHFTPSYSHEGEKRIL